MDRMSLGTWEVLGLRCLGGLAFDVLQRHVQAEKKTLKRRRYDGMKRESLRGIDRIRIDLSTRRCYVNSEIPLFTSSTGYCHLPRICRPTLIRF